MEKAARTESAACQERPELIRGGVPSIRVQRARVRED